MRDKEGYESSGQMDGEGNRIWEGFKKYNVAKLKAREMNNCVLGVYILERVVLANE